MYYTVYKTINEVNGKWYIGAHATMDPYDSYKGSGSDLTKAFKKYGKDNFRKEVLHIFNTSDEMFVKENELVNEDVVKDPMSYNLTTGGMGGGAWNKKVKTCPTCSKEFSVNKKSKRIYCSKKCFSKSMERGTITRTCNNPNCSKEFTTPNTYNYKDRKYCSIQCSTHVQYNVNDLSDLYVENNCKTCGNNVISRRHQNMKYCNKECFHNRAKKSAK